MLEDFLIHYVNYPDQSNFHFKKLRVNLVICLNIYFRIGIAKGTAFFHLEKFRVTHSIEFEREKKTLPGEKNGHISCFFVLFLRESLHYTIHSIGMAVFFRQKY